MSTKLIAAELATAAGVTTVIMHSGHVCDIFDIIEKGHEHTREGLGTCAEGAAPLCTTFSKREDPIKECAKVLDGG